jgi:phage-related tail fiber protein
MLADGLQFLEGSVNTNLVLPSVTEAGKAALVNVDVGEIVWQTTGEQGIYVYDGTVWQYGLDTAPYTPPKTTLTAYGITDAVRSNPTITAGTGTKVTYDSKGLVTSSTTLVLSDLPDIPTTKLTGQISVAQLPTLGSTAHTYNKVYVDATGRVVSGETNTTLAGFGITDALRSNPAITAGTGIKVTYDSKGLVLSSTTLIETDIPNIHTSKLIGKISTAQLPELGDITNTYTKPHIDSTGRVIGGDNPTTLAGYGITDAMYANQLITPNTGIKITYDENGLVLSSGSLTVSDIPELDASKITTGRFSANFLPFIDTLNIGYYTKVLIDNTGRVTAGSNPTTLAGYGITDGMTGNADIPAGTGTKITYDEKGLVTASDILIESDIPDLDANKITTGVFNASLLPLTGTAGSYYNVTTDNKGRVTAGVSNLTIADIDELTSELAYKAVPSDITSAIDAIKDEVDSSGNTLKKLYNLILSNSHEVTVADTAARNALNISSLPTNIFVVNDGDDHWALYKATTLGLAVDANVVKISDPDLLNGALGFNAEGINNKDPDETLSANSDIKYPTQKAVKTYADTKLSPNADIVAGTGTKITYDSKGLVVSKSTLVASDIPSLDASVITSGVFNQTLIPTVGINTALTYVKVNADQYGRVTSGVTALTASDIPNLDASKITTGKITTSMLPDIGISEHTYRSVSVDGQGRVVTGTNPTTLDGYGITDALRVPAAITPATGIKITYDTHGFVLSSEPSLAVSDIPNLPLSKITSGVLESSMLPLSGVVAGHFKKITADRFGRVVGGSDTLNITDIVGLQAALDVKITSPIAQSYVDIAVAAIKNEVPVAGETLKDLYDLIQVCQHDAAVANTTARNNYVVETLPMNIFVENDGDDKWALYRVLFTDVQFGNYQLVHEDATIDNKFAKIADESLLALIASGFTPENAYNKSTNILLVDGGQASNVKYPTQSAVKSYVDNRLLTISSLLTDVIHTTAVPPGTDLNTTYLVLDDDIRLTDSRPPLAHTHLATDVDGFTESLANKIDKGPGVVAGTGAKITYNTDGLVTGVSALEASDIPNISAEKITSGVLSINRLPPTVVYTDENGMVPSGMIPSIALTGTITPASVEDMNLDTTSPIGTIAVIASTNETYVQSSTGWLLLNVPTDHVISINGKNGVIVKITPEDTSGFVDATKAGTPLLTTLLPGLTGDVTSVDGSNVVTLNNIPDLNTAATYTGVQVNSKGLVIGGSTAQSITTEFGDLRYVTQTSLGARNVANGYAGLTANGVISFEQLPYLTGDVTSTNGSNSIILKSIVGLDTSLPFTSVNVDMKGRVIGGVTDPVYSSATCDEKFLTILESGHKNTADGYAGLNSLGLVETTVLPAFLGDVYSLAGTKTLNLNVMPTVTPGVDYTSVRVNNKGLVVSGSTSQLYTKAQIDTTFATKADIGLKNTANGFLALNANAKIDTAFLPQLVINNQFVVQSLGERNLLAAVPGDIAIVLGSLNQSFILSQADATINENWLEFTSSANVQQVNGQTGSVNLSLSDINGRLQANQLPLLSSGGVVIDPDNNDQLMLNDTGTNQLAVGEIGVYTQVTVNSKGLVIQGASPTSIAEFGVTDVVTTLRLPENDDGVSKLVTVDATGKINSSLIPAISVSQIYTFFASDSTKASIIAEDSPALAATQGAMAIVGGTEGATYILTSDTPANIEDWVVMQAPGASGSSGVSSVNGLTGSVLTIAYPDIDSVSTDIVAGGTYNTVTVNDKGRIVSVANTPMVTLSGGLLSTTVIPAFTGDVRTTAGSTITTLAPSGVTAGTYKSVTVDAKGRVTNGTNPTTVAGYGITDALSANKLGAPSGIATLTTGGSLTTNQVPGFTGGEVTSVAGSLNLSLVPSGVAAGTYRSVTVDAKGRVTAATNPATLTAYGITDAINVSRIDTALGVAGLNVDRKISSAYLPNSGVTAGTYTSVTVDAAGRVTAASNPDILMVGSIGAANGTGGLDADKRQTTEQIPIFAGGDVVSAGGTKVLTLATTGVTPGTYTSVTVDAKGRVTAADNSSSSNTFSGNVTAPVFISNVATGTAPLQVTSSTLVQNLNVQKLNGILVTGNGTAGQVLTLDSTSAASWQDSAGGTATGSTEATPNTVVQRTSNGSVYATNYYSTSDKNYKTNIDLLSNVSGLVDQLAPATFNFKSDEEAKLHYGLMAQEVEQIFPALVSTNDADIKSVNYIELIPILLANIQELNARIAVLEGK